MAHADSLGRINATPGVVDVERVSSRPVVYGTFSSWRRRRQFSDDGMVRNNCHTLQPRVCAVVLPGATTTFRRRLAAPTKTSCQLKCSLEFNSVLSSGASPCHTSSQSKPKSVIRRPWWPHAVEGSCHYRLRARITSLPMLFRDWRFNFRNGGFLLL